MRAAKQSKGRFGRADGAFTLLEVMIALGIFFMCMFTILALVSNTLRNARSLRRPQVDAGMAASIYVSTNRFYEGSMSGDFGDVLDDYSWDAETYQFATNGLLQADIVLNHRNSHAPPETLSILVFDPNFQSTPFSGRR
jgi:Tfp pilus assembly protein PilV